MVAKQSCQDVCITHIQKSYLDTRMRTCTTLGGGGSKKSHTIYLSAQKLSLLTDLTFADSLLKQFLTPMKIPCRSEVRSKYLMRTSQKRLGKSFPGEKKTVSPL